jgi:acyl-coenzyme A thioesterase PaaI-like protein
VLALLDTTGAMAAWAVTGPGAFKASTPAIQAQILAPAPRADLVAYGRNVARDGELFWSDVEVATAKEGRVVARGSVLYRIVV